MDMSTPTRERPFTEYLELLKQAGLRPTRQRLAIARLLFAGDNRHVTAESLFGECRTHGISLSLATVYNTLHQFAGAGLLREVVVEPGRIYFDTNTAVHHHFFYADTGDLFDIPADQIRLQDLPEPPGGGRVRRVDVVLRVERDA